MRPYLRCVLVGLLWFRSRCLDRLDSGDLHARSSRFSGWRRTPSLAVLSLAVMPTLAFAKLRVGKEMGSRALIADSEQTWVCSYLSLTLLLGIGAYAMVDCYRRRSVGNHLSACATLDDRLDVGEGTDGGPLTG